MVHGRRGALGPVSRAAIQVRNQTRKQRYTRRPLNTAQNTELQRQNAVDGARRAVAMNAAGKQRYRRRTTTSNIQSQRRRVRIQAYKYEYGEQIISAFCLNIIQRHQKITARRLVCSISKQELSI